jgi:hypothetical protein
VILYTDGLVEQRVQDLQDGVNALREACERHAHRNVQHPTDAVMADLIPSEPEGDACLVAMRVT